MGLNNFSGGGANNNALPPGNGMPIPPQITCAQGNDSDDALDYLINYNEKFKNAGTTLFRDEIVQQTLSVLIGKSKPNALLIGSAGVGKTKIVEDIAYRIESNDPLIPAQLIDRTIYELPLSNIVAGSGIVGQLEEKVKLIIDFIADQTNKAILFIDEIHVLVGESQVYEKIAQILKPALARGDMRVIGATTLQESSNLIEDPAFNRRFSRLIVDELSRDETIEILKHARAGFLQHYNNKISISDDILRSTAIFADEYFSGSGMHRPDTALTLLDRCIGGALINHNVKKLKSQNNPAVLQALQSMPVIPITEKQLRSTAIKLATGNNKKEDLDIDALKSNLQRIKGQDEVVSDLIPMIKRHDLNLFPKKTPLAIMFTGPSGVGKTEIVKIIAKELTGIKPITLNMTEYHSSASINRIIGSPAGYVGSDSHAELPFDCLESNPYQVILLDEFEKCDASVQRLFMAAFDEGCIKTNKGKTVDFSKTIIIATTNAAHQKTKHALGFMTSDAPPAKHMMANELSQWFDIALLNRFHSIFSFNELSKDIYKEIVAEKYQTEIKRIKTENRRINLPDNLPDDDLNELVETTYVAAFGARPVEKTVQTYIEQHVI